MAEATRRDGSERKDVHKFINKFKEEVKINKINKFREYEERPELEKRVEKFEVPLGIDPKSRCIHGNIFENSINQVAKGSSSLDQDLLNEFEERYKKDNQNLYDRYVDGMTNAGSVAWELITEIESRSNSDNLQIEITNRLYRALSENLISDFIYPKDGKPKFICDFKFSSMSPQKYENEYLVNGLIQVLIYCLCLKANPNDVKLGVLVFYSKHNKIVFYESKRYDKECVRLLKKHMKGRPQASDSNSDSESTDTDTSASTSDNDMPDLERLAITN